MEALTPGPRNPERNPLPRAVQREETHRFTLAGIVFENDRLWQPRYDSLFDYARIQLPDRARLEPSFQLDRAIGGLLEITLEIAAAGFRFATVPKTEEVVAYSIAEPHVLPPPGLKSIRLDGSDQRCKLVWDPSQAAARVTTLRIVCDGGTATTPLEKALARVEGGLFLTLSAPSRVDDSGKCAAPPDRGTRPDFIITLEGFDDSLRPVYDIFRPEVYGNLPELVEPEPSFRIQQGGRFRFGIELGSGLPAGLTFLPNCGRGPDQIKVFPFQPKRRTELHLLPTQCQSEGRRCALEWHRPQGRPYGVVGSVDAFFLGMAVPVGSKVPADLDRRLLASDGRTLVVGLDPTIIQPPPCDPITDTCLP